MLNPAKLAVSAEIDSFWPQKLPFSTETAVLAGLSHARAVCDVKRPPPHTTTTACRRGKNGPASRPGDLFPHTRANDNETLWVTPASSKAPLDCPTAKGKRPATHGVTGRFPCPDTSQPREIDRFCRDTRFLRGETIDLGRNCQFRGVEPKGRAQITPGVPAGSRRSLRGTPR